MDEIRLLTSAEIKDYIEIVADAFPVIPLKTPADKEKFSQGIVKSIETGYSRGTYGTFADNALLGGMIFHDFIMNVFNQQVLMGGLGLVAVSLTHKKEKVCSRMVQYFLNHYREKGAFLAGLHPFRPDFYKKMGFGYGNRTSQYQIPPAKLPRGPSKKSIRFLRAHETGLLVTYYNRYMEKHHGCIRLSEYEVTRFFEDNRKIAVYEKNGSLEGYILFYFKQHGPDKFNIHVTQFLYDTREVCSELLTFLNSQSDQVEKLIIDTNDEYFYFLPEDPVNGERAIFLHHQTNVEEIGIMYRVINNRLLFESLKDHNFGGVSQTVKINIQDSFFPCNQESITVQFKNGRPQLCRAEKAQIEIHMDVSDFSSMVLGVVPFSTLYRYAKAEINDQDFLPAMDRLFFGGEKPVCHTRF